MPRIDRGGVPLTFLRRKTTALLIYLAVTGRPHSRGAIADLLWSNLPRERAAANLRKILVDLRNHAPDLALVTRDTITFNPACNAYLDVVAFAEAVDRNLALPDTGTLDAAIGLYQGDFLVGFNLPDAIAFDEWSLLYREHLLGKLIDALHVLAKERAREGKHHAAIAAARRLLLIDPWREEGHRLLMTLHACAGERTAAIVQYQACQRILAEELGVTPLAETTALYQQIIAAPAPRQSLA
jgi:DNA-binding SARP family transcriptional activator